MPDPCGAFFHDVGIAKELQRRGHTVTFVTTSRANKPIRDVYRGIPWVYFSNAENELRAAHVWSSPHFPFLNTVRRLNRSFQKPLVITMHFGENLETVRDNQTKEWAEFLWIVSDHNSKSVRERLTESGVPILYKSVETIRPVMIENEVKFQERGTIPSGKYITLINANVMKGLPLFIALAQRFPNRRFLGVRPYYNRINVPENFSNIKWINIQDDVRDILKDTRILLVPSLYESWGRVAFEAMYNGIPVIHTTPMSPTDPGNTRASGSTEGMCEWIDGTQFMLEFAKFDDWVAAIESLDDADTYAEYSAKAYEQTYNMNIFSDILSVEERFVDYGMRFSPKPMASNKGGVQTPTVPPALRTMRMPAPGGGGMPLRGGRFSLKK